MIKTNWMKRLLTALCVLCLAFAVTAALPAATTAKAENVSLANGDFSSYSSTDYSPSNWTKSGDNNSEIFSGVYDGKAGFDEHGFENTGVLVHDNDYKDFLVFNSKSFTAYTAFSSAAINLTPNSYYQFTIKAKADVAVGNAYFSITGLKDEEISLPIVNDGIWATYKIYLATDFDTSDAVNITLSLGKDEAKARGWAMFDDVSVESLTAYDYAAIQESDNILVADISTPYVDGIINGGDFTVLDYNSWTVGGDKNNASVSVIPATYTEIPGQDDVTVTAPNFNGTTNNVLFISSNDENGGYITLTSNEFTVKPDEYYRISYFVLDRGDTATGGTGATAKLLYKYAGSSEDFKNVTENNIQTSSESTALSSHFGWTEKCFYIAGSSFTDAVAKIEFALGAENSPVAGGVLIDDVRVQKLTPERYAEIAPDASIVADIDGDISDTTGVTNGAFMNYTITDGVRVPANWTQVIAGDNNTASYGYSNVQVNADNADFRVVNSTDVAYANIGRYEMALEMTSSTNTAFGMRSAAISIASASYNVIDVDLCALQVSGYGASIVLRRENGAVVSKIENILNPGTYSFCVKGDADAAVNIYVEIWLGLFDRNQNMDKLAAGSLYVNSVSLTESNETAYDAYSNSTSGNQAAATVDFTDGWLMSDDSYEDKPLLNWTLSKADENAKVEYVVTTLDDEDVIRYTNVSPNASAITLTPSFTISASTYYKVSVQIKINGSLDDIDTNEENYKGVWAGIITGENTYDSTPFTIKDIKNTATDASDEFITLEFYIRGGSADASASLFIGMGENIQVAEGEDPIPFTQGTVYIKGIAVEESSTTEYTDVMNDLKGTQALVNLADTETPEEDDEDDTTTTNPVSSEMLWMTLGSIFFAIVVIAVVVLLLVRHYAKKHPKSAKPLGRPSYDRKNAMTAKSGEPKTKVDKASGAVEIEPDINRFSDDDENSDASGADQSQTQQTSDDTTSSDDEGENTDGQEQGDAQDQNAQQASGETQSEDNEQTDTDNSENN